MNQTKHHRLRQAGVSKTNHKHKLTLLAGQIQRQDLRAAMGEDSMIHL